LEKLIVSEIRGKIAQVSTFRTSLRSMSN